MENYKYKILVLSDLKKTASTTLKSSVNLAKMIDAEIALFHAKEHIDIVDRDNQLTTMRTLYEERKNTKKKIDAIVDEFSTEYDVKIKGNFEFGNVKEEIHKQIKLYNPDIIVLGQRESAPYKLIDNSITRFILKKFNGVIMISSIENPIVPNKKISLGVLNGSNKILKTGFFNDLKRHTIAPLKSFKILNGQNLTSTNTSKLNEEKMIEYEFEQNANSMATLSSYLHKNSINLLCVDRAKNNTKNPINADASLKEVLSKLNVSLLVSEA